MNALKKRKFQFDEQHADDFLTIEEATFYANNVGVELDELLTVLSIKYLPDTENKKLIKVFHDMQYKGSMTKVRDIMNNVMRSAEEQDDDVMLEEQAGDNYDSAMNGHYTSCSEDIVVTQLPPGIHHMHRRSMAKVIKV